MKFNSRRSNVLSTKGIVSTSQSLAAKAGADILAKGGDYKVTEIAGHEVVLENGGEVILVSFIDGFSSTNIVEKIKQS